MANYPWDGTPNKSTSYWASPDDATFRHLAKTFAKSHKKMHASTVSQWLASINTQCVLAHHLAHLLTHLSAHAVRHCAGATWTWVVRMKLTAFALHPQEFKDGITNGAAWYPIYGSMQDWNYVAASCLDLTLELSDTKWPPAQQLTDLFQDNLHAFLDYALVAALGGLKGVGVVWGAKGLGCV